MARGKIFIRDLTVQGILGIKPEERVERQAIVVNLEMWADIGAAAASDDIADAVNYRTVTKRLIAHIEASSDHLVERLVEELAHIVLTEFPVARVRLRVEKPGALRFASSVGIEIERSRDDLG